MEPIFLKTYLLEFIRAFRRTLQKNKFSLEISLMLLKNNLESRLFWLILVKVPTLKIGIFPEIRQNMPAFACHLTVNLDFCE